jgi:phosphoglucomutase
MKSFSEFCRMIHLSNEAAQKWEQWKAMDLADEDRTSLQQMAESQDWKSIEDAFYTDLEFGTGGLRGIMGLGPNRMNRYTVGMATQGLANYLSSQFSGTIKVAIAHDSRNNSAFFARLTAEIFAANGFHVYLFEHLRPTPELSFAIRHLGCQSGVVITASHNPKEYNGYKAYWNDGAQIVAPHDKNIIGQVRQITDWSMVKTDFSAGTIEPIGSQIDRVYLDYLKSLSLRPEMVAKNCDLGIVYTSIHGTGITLLPQLLMEMGFENVSVVQEQAVADGNFPTVVYPNPEEAEAMSMAMQQAENEGAELVLATDPDSDRVGIAIRNPQGRMQLLNGNQTAALLTWYVLQSKKEQGALQPTDYTVKTIVTSELLKAITENYRLTCFDTLTGFKYIAGIMRENEGKSQFLCGGEESYGFLIGDQVRDKDAIGSAAMIAEMATYAKEKYGSLYHMLVAMYEQFGLFRETLISLTKKGKDGVAEIQSMMENFRLNPPTQLGGQQVSILKDYKSSVGTRLNDGSTFEIPLEKSNVLQFLTAEGSIASARPSGTEPKIKFYLGLKMPFERGNNFEAAWTEAGELLKQMQADLLGE